MYNYINRPIRKKTIEKKNYPSSIFFRFVCILDTDVRGFFVNLSLESMWDMCLNKACIGWLIEIICYSEFKRYTN